MSRDFFLGLAAQRLRLPIGVDLVLHRHAEPPAIVVDGERLGAVLAEAAREFGSPVALPLMDLRLEKASLLRCFGVAADAVDSFHFSRAPAAEELWTFEDRLAALPPTARMLAQLGAIRHVARETPLLPVGMSIGPYSLATKLMADPITPTYLAGAGVVAAEEPDVALLEAAARIAFLTVRHSVAQQLAAGARAIFIAEPAANLVFFSPLQLAAGSDIFERLVLAPNRAIAALAAEFGADLLFHCCGELVDPMLDGFCSLRPTLLSLGSSRRLWEDAARVPKDIVLYGNLPSKQFYSDGLMPVDRVATLTAELAERMRATGHPFILGTECDTLCVDGAAETIRAKLAQMLTAELAVTRR
jgi:uroporphyrinogen-III decarboxylase